MQAISKTKLMTMVSEGRVHESFEHSEEGTFDITLMRSWAARHLDDKWVLVAVEDLVQNIRTSRVTESQRVADISEYDAIHDPALAVVLNNNGVTEHLFIDGHHRALKLHAMGQQYQRVYMIDARDVIRPSHGWARNPVVDWGDKIVDGKIVRAGS